MLLHTIRNLLIRAGYHTRPDFIVVGAQKAGTTALFAMLRQHSQITGALTKEVHFFDKDNQPFGKGHYAAYHRYFPLPHKVAKHNLLFEITPSYLYHPLAAERIFTYNPDMKIIISLRDPVYRALSAWNMYHHYGKGKPEYARLHDKRPFKEAIESELERIDDVNWFNDKISYVKRGIYYPQVKKYLEIFPRENILIIEQGQLKKEHDRTIEEIMEFLKIGSEKLKPEERLKSEQDNADLYKEELALLSNFYKPHNEQLYQLLGKDYHWRTD